MLLSFQVTVVDNIFFAIFFAQLLGIVVHGPRAVLRTFLPEDGPLGAQSARHCEAADQPHENRLLVWFRV